jgi:N-acetylglucosamine malate deacetylase 1
MNILAVVAHPDDEILGCGATLLKLREEGHRVFSTVLCSKVDARTDRPDDLVRCATEAAEMVGIEETLAFDFPNIQFNTVPHLDMVGAIEEAIVRFRPEWIFTLHPTDLNIDHRICYEATMAAAMLPQRLSSDLPPTMIRRISLCEVLSATDWAAPSSGGFQPNSFVDVSATFERKLAALSHFTGAMKPFPHSRSLENVRHLAHFRGAQVGIPLAEAFVTTRELIP